MKFIELKLESKTCGLVSALSTVGETGMVVAPKRLPLDYMQEPDLASIAKCQVQPQEAQWEHDLIRHCRGTEEETQLPGIYC